jgi:hypothetical protein
MWLVRCQVIIVIIIVSLVERRLPACPAGRRSRALF